MARRAGCRLMALLAQATILIEASATSGTRHQVIACASLGRPVFAPADLVDRLDWLRTPSVRDVVTTRRESSDVVRQLHERCAPHAALA